MNKSTNPELISTTRLLKSNANAHDAPVWRSLAENLEKSKHQRCVVNLSQINRYTKSGETVTVPGKVLGSGTLNHKVSVAAFQFSEKAKKKIEETGGKCLTFSALLKTNPQGKNLRIMG
ncbi:50S ribosomal protein L18e [Candidatus Bathyarchaeota archaeon]|nr:50S ribosomal protein L18e [Candidatus Bathyarchaeota archaeon]